MHHQACMYLCIHVPISSVQLCIYVSMHLCKACKVNQCLSFLTQAEKGIGHTGEDGRGEEDSQETGDADEGSFVADKSMFDVSRLYALWEFMRTGH